MWEHAPVAVAAEAGNPATSLSGSNRSGGHSGPVTPVTGDDEPAEGLVEWWKIRRRGAGRWGGAGRGESHRRTPRLVSSSTMSRASLGGAGASRSSVVRTGVSPSQQAARTSRLGSLAFGVGDVPGDPHAQRSLGRRSRVGSSSNTASKGARPPIRHKRRRPGWRRSGWVSRSHRANTAVSAMSPWSQRMFFHRQELQYKTQPTKSDALYANRMQEILGGQYGEITVAMQ